MNKLIERAARMRSKAKELMSKAETLERRAAAIRRPIQHGPLVVRDLLRGR